MFDNRLSNAVGGNGTVAKIILAAATVLTTISFIPLAAGQETSIVGHGEGKIIFGGGQPGGPAEDPACISFSTITGRWFEFNCEGEQGDFGRIDSFTTNGKTFRIQGTFEGHIDQPPSEVEFAVTIRGTCDPEDAHIIFKAAPTTAIHKGQVTCTV